MSTTTATWQGRPRSNAPGLAPAIGRAAGALAARVAAWLKPRLDTPAEAAARLRRLANQYSSSQPSFAADLRAAADRHDSFGEGR